MKAIVSLMALVAVSLLSGCGDESTARSQNGGTIDCAIEIQIAVASGLESDNEMEDGDWDVAATCVLPVHSTGGPGHVVCNTDGTVIELQWDDVRKIHYGKRVEFGGGQWRIRNRIDRRDGISQNPGGIKSSPPPSFGTDFEWLASCELDTGLPERTGRRLVIRGRLLPEEAPVQPLNLAELTSNAG